MQNQSALDLYQGFRHQALTIDQFNALKEEYMRRFNTHPCNPNNLDYPMELIYELGFWSGHTLPVPLPCMSTYHDHHAPGVPADTLPYEFKDGSKRMVCPHCETAERNEYFEKYPTEI